METCRAVVVGIPGVGKSTVLQHLVSLLGESGVKVEHVVFGTVMMEEASKLGVKSRDALRSLDLDTQKSLQIRAARWIASSKSDIVLVDTHLFVKTREGFWPGLPPGVLKELAPTHLFLIVAKPEEILSRRRKDENRKRNIVDLSDVEQELELAKSMFAATAVSTGSPMLIVENTDGQAEQAAASLAYALGLGSS